MARLLCLFCILYLNTQISYAFDYSELKDIPFTTVDDWLFQLNSQYLTLNKYSAWYAWELSVNPSTTTYDEASEFGGIRATWRNNRCSEASKLFEDMTVIQKRMIRVLCRGAKYTEYEASELSTALTKIQDIYTDTQICLPSAFDVCLNYNRIWDYTYIHTISDDIAPLDMTKFAPKSRFDHNPLHYFDGTLSPEYYIFRGLTTNNENSNEKEIDDKIRQSPMFCLNIEPQLEKVMTGNFTSLQRPDCVLPVDNIFRWAWESWRLAAGPEIAKYYFNAVYLMNVGARNNGYNDIGECWREELEMDDLRSTVDHLWTEVKPFYKLLHAVLRNALWNKYDGMEPITSNGPLPAHLLGNMWSQDWSAYHKLLAPFQDIDLDENFKKTNWSTLDMVRRAEDFYSSMGLNLMTSKFWTNSKFEKTPNTTKCHGSAANMFDNDDYRMIVCAEKSLDDFYVIVHEMGHIQYYMHLNHLPALFQDAANSAFGEALGDTIFMAMMTPQHLNRLRLLPDKYLFIEKLPKFKENEMRVIHETTAPKEFMQSPTTAEIQKDKRETFINHKKTKKNDYFQQLTILGQPFLEFTEINDRMQNFINFKENNDHSLNAFDLTLLLRMALSKIPQIPFEYLLDVFRWDLFSEKIPFENANDYFWKLSTEEQGIHPPEWMNRHDLFDAAAKFHVADNTPYIRYFLASFLQAQIFKGLCEKTLFGRFNTGKQLPMPLHRCDIYGSKRAGNILKKALKMGSSTHWSEVLYVLTGQREISVEPLLEYYQPLIQWLKKLAIEYDMPIGW